MRDSIEQYTLQRVKVAIGIPTYNRLPRLERAIGSVLNQTHEDLSIVISDNASDDGTRAFLADLAASESRISVLLNESNEGSIANFERVRNRATGQCFMWLGDDDWLDSKYIQTCVAELESDPSVILVAGRTRYHGLTEEWVEEPPINIDHSEPGKRILQYFRLVGANGVFYGVIRREHLAQLPPLSNQLGGDWLYLAAIAFLGRIRTTDAVEIHRDVGGATMSLANVAIQHNLGPVQRHAPQIAIAWFVLQDIGWKSPIYGTLGPLRRLVLGLRASGIVFTRFVPRACIKFLRMRARSLTRLTGRLYGRI